MQEPAIPVDALPANIPPEAIYSIERLDKSLFGVEAPPVSHSASLVTLTNGDKYILQYGPKGGETAIVGRVPGELLVHKVTGEVTGKTSYVNAAMIASQLNKDITNALQAGVELPKWAVDEKGELIVQRPEMFLGEKWTFTPIGDNAATFQQGNEQWTLSKYPESEVFLPLAKLTIGDLVNHVNEVMTRRDNENEWWILDRSEVGRTEYSLYNWRVCHFATDEIHSFATDAMKDQQREMLQRIMHEQIDPAIINVNFSEDELNDKIKSLMDFHVLNFKASPNDIFTANPLLANHLVFSDSKSSLDELRQLCQDHPGAFNGFINAIQNGESLDSVVTNLGLIGVNLGGSAVITSIINGVAISPVALPLAIVGGAIALISHGSRHTTESNGLFILGPYVVSVTHDTKHRVAGANKHDVTLHVHDAEGNVVWTSSSHKTKSRSESLKRALQEFVEKAGRSARETLPFEMSMESIDMHWSDGAIIGGSHVSDGDVERAWLNVDQLGSALYGTDSNVGGAKKKVGVDVTNLAAVRWSLNPANPDSSVYAGFEKVSGRPVIFFRNGKKWLIQDKITGKHTEWRKSESEARREFEKVALEATESCMKWSQNLVTFGPVTVQLPSDYVFIRDAFTVDDHSVAIVAPRGFDLSKCDSLRSLREQLSTGSLMREQLKYSEWASIAIDKDGKLSVNALSADGVLYEVQGVSELNESISAIATENAVVEPSDSKCFHFDPLYEELKRIQDLSKREELTPWRLWTLMEDAIKRNLSLEEINSPAVQDCLALMEKLKAGAVDFVQLAGSEVMSSCAPLRVLNGAIYALVDGEWMPLAEATGEVFASNLVTRVLIRAIIRGISLTLSQPDSNETMNSTMNPTWHDLDKLGRSRKSNADFLKRLKRYRDKLDLPSKLRKKLEELVKLLGVREEHFSRLQRPMRDPTGIFKFFGWEPPHELLDSSTLYQALESYNDEIVQLRTDNLGLYKEMSEDSERFVQENKERLQETLRNMMQADHLTLSDECVKRLMEGLRSGEFNLEAEALNSSVINMGTQESAKSALLKDAILTDPANAEIAAAVVKTVVSVV